jgi:hypothetical protein
MPRMRPIPRDLYRADIASLCPGCCAVCGEVGSVTDPLLLFAPRRDRAVRIELHSACQPVWYRKRGARLIRAIPISSPPPVMPPRRQYIPMSPTRSEMLLCPPPDDAA